MYKSEKMLNRHKQKECKAMLPAFNKTIKKSGRFVDTDGSIYQGDYLETRVKRKGLENIKHGFGILIGKGRTLVGHWQNNLLNGHGTESTNTTFYKGSFSKGSFHGKGVLKAFLRMTNSKFQYNGFFAKGKMEGIGRCTFDSGGIINPYLNPNPLILTL